MRSLSIVLISWRLCWWKNLFNWLVFDEDIDYSRAFLFWPSCTTDLFLLLFLVQQTFLLFMMWLLLFLAVWAYCACLAVSSERGGGCEHSPYAAPPLLTSMLTGEGALPQLTFLLFTAWCQAWTDSFLDGLGVKPSFHSTQHNLRTDSHRFCPCVLAVTSWKAVALRFCVGWRAIFRRRLPLRHRYVTALMSFCPFWEAWLLDKWAVADYCYYWQIYCYV